MGPGFGLFSKLSTRGKLSVGWGNRDYDVFSFDSTKTHPPHCDAEKAEEKKDRKQIENEE